MRLKKNLFWPALFLVFAAPLLADTNVLTNPGFENGTTGWVARSCSISAVTSPVRSGSYSARATGRSAAWQGIQQTLMDKVLVGQTYQISGYVRVSTASAQVKVSIQKTDGNGTTYTNVAVGTADNTSWLYLSGNYTLSVTGTLSELWVYFEGPDSGVDLYVDDASVYGPSVSDDASLQILSATRYQTIDGFGAAGAWYEGTLVSHTQKTTLYNLLFRDLGLDIYRVRNAYDQSGGADYMSRSAQIIAAGQTALGRPLKVLASCWSPPSYLKSNGDTADGGTLIGGPSNYAYDQLADWVADSITAWNNLGVQIDYLSIQNEPDWAASWDTCRYEPTQTSSYAGYAQALEAVYSELSARFGSAMPKLIGPETTGFTGAAGSSLSTYISAFLNHSHVYGYAHHLYNINAGDNPDAYLTAMQNFRSQWGTKPLFQTEYEKSTYVWPDAYNIALLMHNALTVEQVSAYLYWDLFWGEEGGLITLNSTSSYTINSDYWGFKHFSAFIHSGWQRIQASSDSPLLRISAYISPDNQNLTAVIINTSDSAAVNASLTFPDFTLTGGTIYRTTQTQNCENLGAYTGGNLVIPPKSVTTLSLTGFDTGIMRTLTVSSSDGGSVTAPGEGVFTYGQGAIVPVSAAAVPSWRFVQWTGTAVNAGKVADPFSAATTVTLDADYTLQADFEYDLTPPSPQPVWQVPPTAESPSRIVMTAAPCTDDNPPVEYYFECLTNPALSSGWQTSLTYKVLWLQPASEYVFRVKARDSAEARNETDWSSQASGITENPRYPVQILAPWQSGTSYAMPSGTNRLLIFTAHAERNGSLSLTSVTYGGVPMTKIAEREHGTTTRIYTAAFILDEAGLASATSDSFAMTWAAAPTNVGYAAGFLSNVRQQAPVSFVAVNSVASTPSSSISVSTAPLYAEAGDMVFAVGACGNTGIYTPENDFLEALELGISSADGVVAYKSVAQTAYETPALTHDNVNRQAVLGFVVQGAARDWLYGDFNWDLTVNLDDLPIFVDAWLTEDCGPLDLNSDCWLDLTELAEFAAGWLSEPSQP